jgi:hypothetical protein
MTGTERKRRWKEAHRTRLPWETEEQYEGLRAWELSGIEQPKGATIIPIRPSRRRSAIWHGRAQAE